MSATRLLRSAGFRLALVHAAVFTLVTAALFGTIYWSASSFTRDQLTESIRLEGYELVGEARREGIASVAATISSRLLASGEPNLAYMLVGKDGHQIAGNLEPTQLGPGWHTLRRPIDGALGSPDEEDPLLAQVTSLPDGGTLIVAADTHPRQELLEWIIAAFLWAGGAAILVALAGGLALGLSLSRRVEAMNTTLARIIDGELGERLPIHPSGDEFDRLALQVNRTLDRIQALMEGLRQVTNDIAHDLRTPLGRLRQRLERTRHRATTLGEYEQATEQAIQETDAILGTFGALLRIAQIEGGSRRRGFAAVDLSELVRRIDEAYGPVAEAQDRSFNASVQPGLTIRGDADLLTQALANLVENALSHTPLGTPIDLDVHRTENGIVATVADRGPGIREAERGRVLERFVRLDRSRSTPGSGLGLSLVAAVADLHGAKLCLRDNQPGLRAELEVRRLP